MSQTLIFNYTKVRFLSQQIVEMQAIKLMGKDRFTAEVHPIATNPTPFAIRFQKTNYATVPNGNTIGGTFGKYTIKPIKSDNAAIALKSRRITDSCLLIIETPFRS